MQQGHAELQARVVLAQNMRLLRAERSLSQEALADLAGLHRTYIGAIERGERNLSIDNVERIAIALGVHITRLFQETQTPEQKP
ncbi:XRE family transcriptional regulator [Deinococcus metallilatus]|nr:XRE family transcriptional regulator [Deinococcus metallilatus]RXJ12997.1 XRE family transcriptional regulator [Deinococcus metallilatus]TLK27311.1 helix-turn-helix transcriptional regulator [Deinococcus metallilatus]GMA16127.1 transcriptional regulator [Deinococcus metallilatus]